MQAAFPSILGPRKELHDLKGRTALITGGAQGIGFECARAFASVGARIIITNRTKETGEEAIEKIKKETPGAEVEWFGCDLSDLHEVKKEFTQIRDKLDRLDLLVLSGGLNVNQYGEDNDGIDRHFGTNWLGHYYVMNLLYPLILKTSKLPDTPPPRIVLESSNMHQGAPKDIHFGSISEINNKDLTPVELYGRTKLALILGALYLAEKIQKPNKQNVYAIAVHPGIVNTEMQGQWQKAYPGLTGKLIEYASLAFSRSPEQGSYSALWAATSPQIEEGDYNGKYFDDPDHPGSMSATASDLVLASSLWNLSQQLIKERLGDDALESWT